jgi:hypothetical protein
LCINAKNVGISENPKNVQKSATFFGPQKSRSYNFELLKKSEIWVGFWHGILSIFAFCKGFAHFLGGKNAVFLQSLSKVPGNAKFAKTSNFDTFLCPEKCHFFHFFCVF